MLCLTSLLCIFNFDADEDVGYECEGGGTDESEEVDEEVSDVHCVEEIWFVCGLWSC